jgi:protein SPT2
MATFQALMALSATQTRESQSAVHLALVQRQRKEELRRKQQEEQEKKQKEMERKLRMKHFEDQRREEEMKRHAEQAEKAKEAALQRREEEQREALRYGPKKAKSISSTSDSSSPKWPSSSSQNRTREEVRKRRLPDDIDDDAPEFLTREEKRERKQQQEMRKLFHTGRRSAHAGGYSKTGRRLPGGAVDVTTTSQTSDVSPAAKSVKERLAAMPNTLTKLNVVKRDTRTIDEILQDRAKAKEGKVLDGDEAREFTDWFGSSKKKDAAKRPSNESTANSGANSPCSRKCLRGIWSCVLFTLCDVSLEGSNSNTLPLNASVSKKMPPLVKPSLLKSAPARLAGSFPASQKSADSSAGPVTSNTWAKAKLSKTTSNMGKFTKSSLPSDANRSTTLAGKKRSRSSSRSESPPPAKKRGTSTDIRDEIWQILGKNRSRYMSMDVFSDDEEMEADATALEKEELQRFSLMFSFMLTILSLTLCVL